MVDPIEHQIKLTHRPGAFIHDRAFLVCGGLEGVAAQIDELQKTDAVRAAGHYEAYLADSEDAVCGVCRLLSSPNWPFCCHSQAPEVG